MSVPPLSQAIRLASTLPGYNWGDIKNCVCGKVREVMGKFYIIELWPWVYDPVQCPGQPCDDFRYKSIWSSLSHLAGPLHNWPMSRIADWVETLEKQLEPQVEPVHPEAVRVE